MNVLVVLSGGLDSTVALAHSVERYGKENITTLTFNYGSKHNPKENAAAARVAGRYGVKNTLLGLPFVNQLFKSDLLSSGGEIPEGHYAQDNMKRTVVPFRNGIMLSIAAGYAESLDAEGVILGNHAGDHAIYPDCRQVFSRAMAEAIKTGTWKGLDLLTPFVEMTKTDIAKLGRDLGAPIGLTWSCYKGGDIHCGKCGTCVERLEALHGAGVDDGLEYEDREYWKAVVKSPPRPS